MFQLHIHGSTHKGVSIKRGPFFRVLIGGIPDFGSIFATPDICKLPKTHVSRLQRPVLGGLGDLVTP